MYYLQKALIIKLKVCIRDDRLISPVNEQVLLHSEALRASVAVEAVVVSPQLRFGLVALAFALRKLG